MIYYNRQMQKHPMFQPQMNPQFYPNQQKPMYVPNIPYNLYNINTYQPNINQLNQMQQNPGDYQKNFQNQMGIVNPNNPAMQQQQQLQPQYQKTQQYPNSQISASKQANMQQYNKSNLNVTTNGNSEALQQQRNFKDPSVPLGVQGYQISQQQQPFIPVNPNIPINANIQGNPNMFPNQGVFNPNFQTPVVPTFQNKQPQQLQIKIVDQNNSFRDSVRQSQTPSVNVANKSNSTSKVQIKTQQKQLSPVQVQQPFVPSAVDQLTHQLSENPTDDYFQYILMFGYRSKKGYQATNPSKVNQDSIVICTKLKQETSSHYFGVCDGHGSDGHHVSGFLKQNFPPLLNSVNHNQTDKQFLLRVYAKLGQKLVNQAKFDLNFSGSTCVGCFLNHNKLYCCNVGDSRAVVGKLTNGKWVGEALSRDHKATQEQQMQRVLNAGGHIEPVKDYQNNPVGVPRIWLKGQNYPGLAMTRSFGDLIASGVGVINVPEIRQYMLTKQDKIIVVGSDGLWQFLSNQNVIDLVSPFYQKNQFQAACNRLLEFTLTLWNNHHPDTIDDISFIVAFIYYDVENEA